MHGAKGEGGTKVTAACLTEAFGTLSLKGKEQNVPRLWLQKGKGQVVGGGRELKG